MQGSKNQSFEQMLATSVAELGREGAPAMGRLYDLTSKRLVRYATTLTRHQHDAEDAVQSGLVKVALKAKRFAEVERPWPYLLRVVRNEALQIARKEQRVVLCDDLSDLRMRQQVDQAEQDERNRAVWNAIRKLPPDQAEVVALKIWESLTFAEISEVLRVSPNTVASRYRYGIAKLSQSLGRLQREAAQ